VRTVELIDASVLVELLKVPGKSDRHEATVAELERRAQRGDIELRLPVAALVEAGNHVSKIADGGARRDCALRLERMIVATLERTVPWSFATLEWDVDFLRELVHPSDAAAPSAVQALATQYIEMGDLLIVNEFRRLRASLDPRARDVGVWTYDSTLNAVIDAIRG
jgi:hypothetical protein